MVEPMCGGGMTQPTAMNESGVELLWILVSRQLDQPRDRLVQVGDEGGNIDDRLGGEARDRCGAM